MKKHMVALVGASLVAAMPLIANAGVDNPEGGYVSVNLQGVFPEDSSGVSGGSPASFDFDTGAGIGIAGGYAMPNHFRIEGEFTYRQNDVDITTAGGTNGDALYSTAYMVNLLYDVDTNSPITPYLGGGLGIANLGGDDTGFAYQAMAGLGYHLTQQHEVYAGYRYFGSDSLEDEPRKNLDYSTHNVEVGYRFHF